MRNGRKLDVVCLTETHLREAVDLNEEEYAYRMVFKGRSKQHKKDGRNAVFWQVSLGSLISWEELSVGDCDMSDDIMAVKLEYGDVSKWEHLHVCVCYMTLEGQVAQGENKHKSNVVKNFVNPYGSEKVLVVGDMNGHIGLLGERMNANGRMLREVCEDLSLEILNEPIVEGRVTWCRCGQQSAIDYVLTNEWAREKVKSL